MCHQESSLLTAEFGHIWESTCGLGGHGRVGCGGGLVAEGAGIFAVIWGWLVGRRGVRTWLHSGYCIPPVGLPSGAGTSSMGLSTGFRLLGHFHGFILGTGLLLWIVGQFCGSSGGFVGVFMGG